MVLGPVPGRKKIFEKSHHQKKNTQKEKKHQTEAATTQPGRP